MANKCSPLSNSGFEVDFVELDEMHSYIGNKKTIAGFGLLSIDRGKSSSISLLATEVLRQLWGSIGNNQMNTLASDYWKSYEHIVPKDKHIRSKAETFTVEGYNSLFRHFLARMRRKSKCCSKSLEMLTLSV